MKPYAYPESCAAATAGCLLLVLLVPAAAWSQGTTACSSGSPAQPVEQFRTIAGQGTFEMWPPSLQPADPQGQALPAERDSTGYSGSQLPGQFNGLELFNDLDIVESPSGTHLFMAYNAGFQIWDIGGASASNPQLLSQRDGWNGNFFSFQATPTEFYFLVWDIAALDPAGSPGDTLVALAADGPVGFSIWDASNKSSASQLYQNTGDTGEQVAVANISGRSYAFVGNSGGVTVYDMTRAREVGGCNESASSTLCGGATDPVWRGSLTPWPFSGVSYLDVMTTQVGGQTKHFLAASGSRLGNYGVAIREITDAASLPPANTAIIEGLSPFTWGVDLFEIDGHYYLGATQLTQLQVFDVTPCITSAPGCGYSDLRVDLPTLDYSAIPVFTFVQFSESNGRPFLYKGYHTLCDAPPVDGGVNPEYLLDLSNLPAGGEAVIVRGDTYLDPGHSTPQRVIDYWSSYYDGSSGGYSRFAPRSGRFHGSYFYRAGHTIFDVHQWTGDVVPEAAISATTSERWLSTPALEEWVSLSGECTVGSDTGWIWTAVNAGVGEPDPVIEPLAGNLARVRGDCAVATCPPREILVDADVLCDSTPLASNQLSLVLEDPRPSFDTLRIVEPPKAAGPPPEYPVCLALNLEALSGTANEIGGKALTSYTWEITAGEETWTCTSAAADPGLSCSENSLAWDTEVVSGRSGLIFTDGFESGDTASWSDPEPSSFRAGAESRPALRGFSAKGVAGVTHDVKLTATNEHGSIQQTTQVTLAPLAAPTFLGDGFTIPATPPADGIYDFAATAESATEYRWEFQQDAGLAGDAGCRLVTPCQIRTTSGPNVQYQWPIGNTAGSDYQVWLEISNCDDAAAPVSTSRAVQDVVVVAGSAPDITDFLVVTSGSCECSVFFGCQCPAGSVSFTLALAGACTEVNFDWGDGTDSNGLSCIASSYSHTYPSTGSYTLTAEACLGAKCTPQTNLTNLGSPVPLTIIP